MSGALSNHEDDICFVCFFKLDIISSIIISALVTLRDQEWVAFVFSGRLHSI